MPEKDGADDKKKMKNEEVVDYLKDTGRYKRSPDTKDATSYPPSKEMRKTQKVNKGPSALDIVKKKYKGQIMDVKKEELDLTQVAEAFGGYIVEAPVDSEGNIKPKTGDAGKERRLINKEIKKVTSPKPGEKKKSKQTLQKFLKTTDVEAEKRILDIQQDPNLKKMDDVAKKNINKGQDKLLDKITGGGQRKTDTRMSLEPPKQMNIDGTFDEPKKGRKKRSDAGQPRGRSRRRYFADPDKKQLQLDLTKKSDRKQVKQDVANIVKNPRKTAGAVLQRTFLTPDKGVRGLLKSIRKDPISTAIAGGIARDSVRRPQLPSLQVPTVKGGKVGRRTAG